MFKNHDSGIITLSLFTTFTSLFFWCVIILLMRAKSWLQKMLICSEPDLEKSLCAAQIWGLGAKPQAGTRAPGEGLGRRSPPEIFRYYRGPYALSAIRNLTKMGSTSI